jgi:hypothetical protein
MGIRTLAIAAVANAAALSLMLAPDASAYPQREPAASAPGAPASHGKFIGELQRIFGRFSNSDLRRAFDMAAPPRCIDLLSGTGKWHEVAFFNEYRPFGQWHRKSLGAVKRGFTAYIFHGACIGAHSSVQVTTEFPVDATLKTSGDGTEEADIKVNPPVTARFESQSGAYAFDLPYLFRISGKDEAPRYALNARTRSDRYAADVTSRWECKSVAESDVTYQFLICHTRLVFHDHEDSAGSPPLGTSAFSILSDGQEASASVQIMFQ